MKIQICQWCTNFFEIGTASNIGHWSCHSFRYSRQIVFWDSHVKKSMGCWPKLFKLLDVVNPSWWMLFQSVSASSQVVVKFVILSCEKRFKVHHSSLVNSPILKIYPPPVWKIFNRENYYCSVIIYIFRPTNLAY